MRAAEEALKSGDGASPHDGPSSTANCFYMGGGRRKKVLAQIIDKCERYANVRILIMSWDILLL